MKTFVKRLIACLFMSVLIVGAAIVPVKTANAESAEKEYTDVLTDLSKDKSFDTSYYPLNATDYSLKVIQIAEGTDKELFVYVYQPSADTKNLVAKSINISVTQEIEITPRNYTLKLLSSYGTLYKYVVNDFTVSTDPARYYAIPSIFRNFDSSIDQQVDNGNTIDEVSYEVARQWCFSTINGKPYVSVVDIQTIVVTDKFVGFVRYPDGFKLFTGAGACDSHFVAFNTDKKIDKLLEADVEYITQKASYDFFTEDTPFNTEFGDIKTDNYASLKYTDKVEHTGAGLFARTYKWDRIQSVDDFISTEDRTTVYHGALVNSNVSSKLTDEALNELKGKKWVLRFVETSYNKVPKSAMGAGTYYHSEITMVGSVTILRLKFETDGITYNLGVIDNKQTGERDSSGLPVPVIPEESTWIELTPTAKGCMGSVLPIIFIVMLIVVLMFFAPFIPLVVQLFSNLFNWSAKTLKQNIQKVRTSEKKGNKKGKKKKQKSKRK